MEPKFTQKIDVPNDDLKRVVRVMADRRGKNGPRIGFNTGPDGVGFVIAEDGLNLQEIVDEVLATPRPDDDVNDE